MALRCCLFILICLGVFFYLSWKMTLFTLGVMLPTMCFGPIYGRFMKVVNKAISENKAKASEAAEECFSNVRTVKAFSTEDHETTSYWNKNEGILA